MDETLSAEVWSQGIGIVSLLDARSNLLAVWGWDPGYSGQQCNSTSERPFRNCICSWSFFPFFPIFLTCARSEAGAMAPQCRWQEMWERCLLQCRWVQTKPLLARAAPTGKQTLIQSCAMLPDDSLQLAFHSLGNTEGRQGADQHLADTVSPYTSSPFQRAHVLT